MTTSGTTRDNKWQRMTISGYFGQFSFFFREESTNRHSKENPLKGRPWRGPTELRADLAKQAR